MNLSFVFTQNVTQANNVEIEPSIKQQNQIRTTQKQTTPEQQQEHSQLQRKAKPKAQPRKMDLSEYDTANDEIIAVSSAPQSAVTSDERVT